MYVTEEQRRLSQIARDCGIKIRGEKVSYAVRRSWIKGAIDRAQSAAQKNGYQQVELKQSLKSLSIYLSFRNKYNTYSILTIRISDHEAKNGHCNDINYVYGKHGKSIENQIAHFSEMKCSQDRTHINDTQNSNRKHKKTKRRFHVKPRY